MWASQWPLSQEKLEAAHKLVQEQLELGHIKPSTSPWNTPIFVIKKKQANGDCFTILERLMIVWSPWAQFS